MAPLVLLPPRRVLHFSTWRRFQMRSLKEKPVWSTMRSGASTTRSTCFRAQVRDSPNLCRRQQTHRRYEARIVKLLVPSSQAHRTSFSPDTHGISIEARRESRCCWPLTCFSGSRMPTLPQTRDNHSEVWPHVLPFPGRYDPSLSTGQVNTRAVQRAGHAHTEAGIRLDSSMQ